MTDGIPPEDDDAHGKHDSSQNGANQNGVDRQSAGQHRKGPSAGLNGRMLSRAPFASSDKDFDGANDEALSIRLAVLEIEHRDLDAAISSLELNSPYERLTIARLKKKKLQLKDQIQEAKDAMLPDIIA